MLFRICFNSDSKIGGGSGLNKIVSFSHRDTGQGIAICGP